MSVSISKKDKQLNEKQVVSSKMEPTTKKQSPKKNHKSKVSAKNTQTKKSDKKKKYRSVNTSSRQLAFIKNYLNPESETFDNALQSAIKAGYTRKYAENILSFNLKWLDDGMKKMYGSKDDKESLINQAKNAINEALNCEDLRIKQDTAKFILKSTGEFSEKQEIKYQETKPLLGDLLGGITSNDSRS